MGGVKGADRITEKGFIKKILLWIGFTTEDHSDRIYDNSINSFSDISMLTEKDISNLSADFSGRNQAIGEIHFGMRITKRTI